MKRIAHRSGPTLYPEQTVASAKLALEQGADLVEIDTRFTADGTIAVCHDDNALRVFGVDKKISEMTAEEFTALRHRDAPEYGAHLLTDYVKAEVAPLLIHVKEGGERLKDLLETLRAFAFLDKVTLGLTSAEDIRIVKALDASVPILAFMPNADCIAESAEAGADYIRLWEKWITPERISAILDCGKKVWIMAGRGETVGYTSEDNIALWKTMPIDGILVNDIRVLR